MVPPTQIQYSPKPFHRISVFGFALGFFLLFFTLGEFISPLRYLKYFLPFMALAIFAAIPHKPNVYQANISKYLGKYLLLFAGLILYSSLLLFFKADVYGRFFKEVYFILAPLSALVILFRYYKPVYQEGYVRAVFWVATLTYLFKHGIGWINDLDNMTSLLQVFISSQLRTESGISFLFGLLFLYFFFQKNLPYSLFSFFLVLVSFKRITIAGILISLFAYYVLRWLQVENGKFSRTIPLAALGINLLAISIIFNLGTGSYDQLVANYTDLPLDAILMGRRLAYENIFLAIGEVPLTGIGLGKTVVILNSLSQTLPLLHSDILKLFLEFGPFFFSVMIFSLYRLNMRSSKALALMVFLNTLFISDNVLIYFNVMFCFYLIQGWILCNHLMNSDSLSRSRPDGAVAGTG